MDDPPRDDLADLLIEQDVPSGCFGTASDDPSRNHRTGLLYAAPRACPVAMRPPSPTQTR